MKYCIKISFIIYFFYIPTVLSTTLPITNNFAVEKYNINQEEIEIVKQLNQLKQKQEYNQALELLTSKKTIFNNQLFYHYSYAELLLAIEKEQEIFDYLTQLIQTVEEKTPYLALRGIFLLKLNYQLSAFEDFIIAYKDNYEEINFLLHFYSILEKENKYNNINYDIITKLLKKDPTNDQLLFYKSKLEITYKQNYQKAYKTIKKAISIKEKTNYYDLLLHLEANTGKSSYKTIVNLIEKFPNNLNYYKKYLELKKIQVTDEEYLNIIKTKINSIEDSTIKAEYLFLLAKNQLIFKQEKDAIETYLTALDLKSNKSNQLILAKLLWNTKRYEDSIKHLKQLYKLEYKDVFIYRGLASYYNLQNLTISAEEIIIKGLYFFSNDIILLEEYSNLAEKKGQYHTAIEATIELIKVKPNNNSYLSRLGILYKKVKEYENSQKYLLQSLNLVEDNIVRYHLADNYYQKNEYSFAIEQLQQILKQDKDFFLAYRLKAIIKYQQQKYNQALMNANYYLNAIKNEDTYLQNIKIEILFRLQKLDLATTTIEKYIQTRPSSLYLKKQKLVLSYLKNDPQTIYNIENYLTRYQPNDHLLEIYYLLKKDPSLWRFTKQEKIIHQKILSYQIKDAKDILTKNIPKDQNNFYYLQNLITKIEEITTDFITTTKPTTFWQKYYLGSYFLDTQQNSKAEVIFNQLLHTNENFIWIYPKIGTIYERKKIYNEAITAYNHFLEQFPKNEWALLRLGLVYDLNNQVIQSEEIYTKLLEINPRDYLALNNLSWLYLTKKKGTEIRKKALKLAQKAVSISPDSANLDTLAEAYYQNQEIQKALETIEKALTLDRKNSDHFKKQRNKFLKSIETIK